jgi:hypothetical protein
MARELHDGVHIENAPEIRAGEHLRLNRMAKEGLPVRKLVGNDAQISDWVVVPLVLKVNAITPDDWASRLETRVET